MEISILQYADDTVFFGEATMSNVKAIKAMLRSFELVSGLKINFAKSSFGVFGDQINGSGLPREYAFALFAEVMRRMHLIYFSVVIKSCRCGGSRCRG